LGTVAGIAVLEVPAEERNPNFPFTLDLRRV
jgi:hypothetical protein